MAQYGPVLEDGDMPDLLHCTNDDRYVGDLTFELYRNEY